MTLLELSEEFKKVKAQFDESWEEKGPFKKEYRDYPVVIQLTDKPGKIPEKVSTRGILTITGFVVSRNSKSGTTFVEVVIGDRPGVAKGTEIFEKLENLLEEVPLNAPVFFFNEAFKDDDIKYYHPYVANASTVGALGEYIGDEDAVPYIGFSLIDPFVSKINEKTSELYFTSTLLGVDVPKGEDGLKKMIEQMLKDL